MTEIKRSLYSFDLEEMRNYLKDNGFAKYASDQIYNWLYKRFQFSFDSWSNVSKKIKAHFTENLDLTLPEVVRDQCSKDGTRKFLLKLQDGQTVEAVSIPGKDRLTMCISSQVGCPLGCMFCNTGTMGFIRNLEVGEIIGQFLSITSWMRENVDSETTYSNIVFMGQGEPLLNFENVKHAIEIFMTPKGIGLGQRKITLSTSGVISAVNKLVDFPPVNIAISLHSAFNDVRSELMPGNKIFNLDQLFEVIKKIPLKAHRWITYEYMLIDGINDRQEDIDQLIKLLDKNNSKINIILYNEVPGLSYKSPTDAKANWFSSELLKQGYTCTIRYSKGSDILAACGQLKSESEKS